jgi:hypothetical protein
MTEVSAGLKPGGPALSELIAQFEKQNECLREGVSTPPENGEIFAKDRLEDLSFLSCSARAEVVGF